MARPEALAARDPAVAARCRNRPPRWYCRRPCRVQPASCPATRSRSSPDLPLQTSPLAQPFPALPFGANVASMSSPARPTAIRGPVLTFTGDPFRDGLERTLVHEPDAIVAMQDGRITHFGPAARVAPLLPPGIEIRDFGKDALISAGFIDTHVHFPQTPMIASHGAQLLDWLEPLHVSDRAEIRRPAYTRRVATRVPAARTCATASPRAASTAPSTPHSADILFEEAEALGLRLAAGKVLMDRNAPDGPARHRAVGLRRLAGADRANGTVAAACSMPSRRASPAPARRSNSPPPARCGASIPTA